MNRRDALTRIAAVGCVSLAGCSSVLGPDGTVLGRIEVINSSLVANRIRLMVARDDESLLDREIALPGMNDEDDGTPGALVEPQWSEISGQYTVSAVHYDDAGNRETSTREYTFTADDYAAYYGDSHEDPGCLGATVTIGDLDESENGTIGIGPTYMDDPCGDSTTN